MAETRVVEACHGHFASMGFKWRARIEYRQRWLWFGWGREVCEWRFVLERRHVCWEDVKWGEWTTEREARRMASELLDAIEAPPVGEYLTK